MVNEYLLEVLYYMALFGLAQIVTGIVALFFIYIIYKLFFEE